MKNDTRRVRLGGKIIGTLWGAVLLLERACSEAQAKGPGEARAEMETLLELARRTVGRVTQAYDAVENQ